MWLEDPRKVFIVAVASVAAGGIIIAIGLALATALSS